ncbi:MAG: TIGR01459 family HAD-type hydrolase [Rhodobacter sp.]|nr:TIGR01459 family HAD-type hydrolase [Rhodobacter sp.]
MVQQLGSLAEVASNYDAIVLDQWGVLHDGSAPYPFAIRALAQLKARKLRLAVLSNSGKRAEPNKAQLSKIGFAPGTFDCVMTSGEALWREFSSGLVRVSRLYPITRGPGDAEAWAEGLDVSFVPIDRAEAVLLMGLPDTAGANDFDEAFAPALRRNLPVYCSNPDRTAPRAGGVTVVMPGTLAHSHAACGGNVRFVGKPYLPVFRAVETALGVPPEKLLMVGDSLEHDIAGAHAAGWHSVFIRGGLHAESFRSGGIEETVADLARKIGAPLPEFTLEDLR